MRDTGFLLVDGLLGLAVGAVVLAGVAAFLFQAQMYETSLAALRVARDRGLVRAYAWGGARDLAAAPASGWGSGESLSLVTPCSGVASVRAAESDGMRLVSDTLDVVLVDSAESARLGDDCGLFGLLGLQLRQEGKLVLGPRVIAHVADCLIRNGRSYALVGATSTQVADPDLFVVDITTPSEPLLVSTLDVGDGVFSLDAHSAYAYLGLDAPTAQLLAIDISDLQHPRVSAQRSLPGVSGSFPEARTVLAYDGVVYVGTYETAGPELHLFRAGSEPKLDVLSSVSLGHSVRSFVPYIVRDSAPVRRLMYVASSADAAELLVFDVTDPVHPVRVAALDLPGAGNATALARTGTELLVGRQQVAGQPTVDVVDVRDLLQPVRMGGSGALLKSGSVVNGLVYSNHRVVFTSTDPAKPLASCAYDVGTISACSQVVGYPDPGRVDVCDGIVVVPTQHALAVVSSE